MTAPTPDDLTQTRRNPSSLTMRFDRQPETTRRLHKVIRLDAESSVPLWRRVLRWLKRIK